MNERRVSVRLQAVGGDKMKAQFASIGNVGGRALRGVEGAARRTSFQMQNAAFQVGDFFVQVNSGTGATRALAQQLPQLLGSFGLFGALAGAAAAALVPLVSSMFEGGDEAETLDEIMKDLNSSTDAFASSAKRSQVPLQELVKLYGDLADEVLRARQSQADLDQARSEKGLDLASDAVARAVVGGDVNLAGSAGIRAIGAGLDALIEKGDILRESLAEVAPLSDAEKSITDLIRANDASVEVISAIKDSVQELADTYKITAEEAERIAEASAVLREADDTQSRVEAADALRGVLIDVFGSAEQVDDAMDGVFKSLLKIIDRGGEMTAAFSDAADEAERIARAQYYVDNAKTIGAYQQYARTRLAAPDTPVKHRPSRGGGRRSSIDPSLREAGRLFDKTRNAAEKYEAEVARINELHEMFGDIVTDDVRDRALAGLAEDFDKLDTYANDAAGSIRSAFEGLFDDPKQALEDLGQQLIRLALFKQLANSFPAAFGVGGIIPLAGARAAGGPVSAGRAYLVGERGPEPFIPNTSGTILPHSALGSGGGGTTVEVHNYGSQPARTERSKGPDGRELIKVIVGEEIARGGFDKPMAGRFQARPQPVKR